MGGLPRRSCDSLQVRGRVGQEAGNPGGRSDEAAASVRWQLEGRVLASPGPEPCAVGGPYLFAQSYGRASPKRLAAGTAAGSNPYGLDDTGVNIALGVGFAGQRWCVD